MTKAGIPQERIHHLMRLMGCEFRGGRPESAPTLRREGGTKTFAVHPDLGVTPRGQHRGSGAPESGNAATPAISTITERPQEVQAKTCAHSLEQSGAHPVRGERRISNRHVRLDEHLRWIEEGGEDQGTLSQEYLIDVARRVLGLPHSTWDLVRAHRIVSPEAPREVEEPTDQLIEHGLELGAAGEGRTPLPRRDTVPYRPVERGTGVHVVGGRIESEAAPTTIGITHNS